jgi:hypothetical protein
VKLSNPLQHLVDGFAHNQLFAREQSDHGIRRVLNKFDQVRIDQKRLIVQSSQVDHVCFRSRLAISGR